MHRLIISAPEGLHVDHRDHDGLHNWRTNLRLCTVAENQHNQGRRADNTSGYKGVCRHEGLWQAQIRNRGVIHYLGRFPSPEEAAAAYNKAALAYFGAFACLNDIGGRVECP